MKIGEGMKTWRFLEWVEETGQWIAERSDGLWFYANARCDERGPWGARDRAKRFLDDYLEAK